MRVSAETKEQFLAALLVPQAELVYLDSGFTDPQQYAALAEKAHAAGKRAGLRLPQIWRTEADRFFQKNADTIKHAGFDAFLLRQIEGLGFLEQAGLLQTAELVLDYTIYDFNGFADAMLTSLYKPAFAGNARRTFPLELNSRELCAEGKRFLAQGTETELVVYGRIPMMVSAQCIRKTSIGCDKKPVCMTLSDRTGARLPVKNCCRFCYNVIFNSLPTMLFDFDTELDKIPHTAERYEFTTESGETVTKILTGQEKPGQGNFTRGYWKRGIQ